MFALSCGASVLALLLSGGGGWTPRLALPALVLSGWAFGGHLITLDDEWPGGWSNPEGDPKIWRRSAMELFVKLVVFLLVLLLWFVASRA